MNNKKLYSRWLTIFAVLLISSLAFSACFKSDFKEPQKPKRTTSNGKTENTSNDESDTNQTSDITSPTPDTTSLSISNIIYSDVVERGAQTTVQFFSNDSVYTFYCRIDELNSVFADCGASESFTIGTTGIYTLSVYAVDYAAPPNESSIYTREIKVLDTTPPTVSILAPASATKNSAIAVTFNTTSNDVSYYNCLLLKPSESRGTTSLNSCGQTESFTLSDIGVYTIYAQSVDNNGNTSSETSVDVSVSNTTPTQTVITITGGPSNPDTNTSANITFYVTPLTQVTCLLDGVADTNCVSPKTYTNLSTGITHVFSVYANDGTSVMQTYSWAIEEPVANELIPSQVSVGSDFSCTRFDSGEAKCWGINAYGQLGDGTTINKSNPTTVQGITNVAEIATGAFHTCARLNDNTVKCWGRNNYGQLGNGSTTNSLAPVQVNGLADVISIFAGDNHSCAITFSSSTYKLYCWGLNNYGQLGNGTKTDSNIPVEVDSKLAASNEYFVSASLSNHHTCAKRYNGKVYCWGRNSYGQLGDNTTAEKLTPTEILDNGASITLAFGDVAVGGYHSCAFTVSNILACWGLNTSGQIGNGTMTPQDPLGQLDVVSSARVVKLALGALHSCAIDTDSAVMCWGYNTSGQLGNGTTVAQDPPGTPQIIAAFSNISKISSRKTHTCALSGDNKVYCWGSNSAGQIGNGTTSAAVPTPYEVTGF